MFELGLSRGGEGVTLRGEARRTEIELVGTPRPQSGRESNGEGGGNNGEFSEYLISPDLIVPESMEVRSGGKCMPCYPSRIIIYVRQLFNRRENSTSIVR